MKIRARHNVRRFTYLAVAGIIALVLIACTGRGGGQLPPGGVFTGSASFGFSFSCEDSGGLNPPTGQLRIQLDYTDHGSNPIGSSFGIHGIVDQIDPVLESMQCIGENPPPGGNELIFLGRYRLTSGSPSIFPAACKTTSPSCRFEVIVRDDDQDGTPSSGDFFSIKLSSATALTSQFDSTTPVFYARAGTLSSGNLTVD